MKFRGEVEPDVKATLGAAGPFSLEGAALHHEERVELQPEPTAVTVRFVKPSPPYTVGQLLELPEKTAARLIRAGIAEKDGQ